MLLSSNSSRKIRRILIKPHEFILHLFDFRKQPLASIKLYSFLSPLSSRNSDSTSGSTTKFSAQCGGKYDFDDTNDGYEGFCDMGSENSGALSISGCPNYDSKVQNSNFDSSDEDELSSEVEGEDANDDNDVILNSFHRKSGQNVEFSRVEIGEEEFRHPLVREICRLVQLRSFWTPKLEGEFRHLLRSLKPLQVCAVLCSLDDERVALKFFYWADRQWRYRHYPVVYSTMLEILSRTKLCQGAKRILRLMARREIQRFPEVFGFVMVSYSRAGKLRDAMKILTLMQRAGIEPNLSICNTAIHILVMGNKLENALKFFERMNIIGITSNVVTFNCLIKGYCDLHRFEDAMELIDEMPFKGCHPDKVSYYTVMGFLCKDKRIKDVRELMEKMVRVSKLMIDQVTYNTLIHMLTKHGHGEEALEFLREAEERGFRIDKVGYSAIVHSFCKKGRIDIAKELVSEMFSKGCIPDVVTYTAVLDGFCRIGEVNQAKKMLKEMSKHGCKPNTISYTALLNGLCRNGNSAEAKEIMNMSEEEWWTPNAITYSVVMHGLRREGKLDEACGLVSEMTKKGFFPTPVEINLLIQSLCREEKTNEAKRFLVECLNKGCAINVVNFTTLIHGFCQKDDLGAALSLLDDMYLSNKHPDVVTYTTLIDALGKKGKIEEATELTMKMLKKGLVPSSVTYRTVIHRYCQMDGVGDLLKLLDKMLLRQNCRTVYNQVIEKLCSFGKLDEANKLLSEVLRTASKIDAKTCHVLMKSYLKRDMPLSAYNVACRMFNRNLIPDLKLCENVGKRLVIKGNSEEADRLMLRFVERGCISPQYQEH